MRIITILLTLFTLSVEGWTSFKTYKLARARKTSSKTCCYNVPPPSEDSIAEFTAYASKQSPPASFYELQQDCVRAVRLARRDGHPLLEIEYPPLPANVLDMDEVSAYDVTEANLKHAIDFSKGILTSGDVKKIAILFPDEAEAAFGVEKAGSKSPYPGVTIGSLLGSEEGDDRLFKPEQVLLNLFGRRTGTVKPLPENVDIAVCLTFSAQELPDIEELHLVNPDTTIIFFNLKLDVLRGDLGAPAFPGKDFQDRFLSRVKPVYYLRTRQYSRSTPNPPFIVNFQGCLFRVYPGEYQTLLDTGTGRYRRLLGSPIRPALGEFKQQLTNALVEQGVLKDEGSTLNFLRTGYKTTTWWEEPRENSSDAWRT